MIDMTINNEKINTDNLGVTPYNLVCTRVQELPPEALKQITDAISNDRVKLEKAIKALEFYANEGNWWWEKDKSNKTACVIEHEDVSYKDWNDGCAGETAREALKSIKG